MNAAPHQTLQKFFREAIQRLNHRIAQEFPSAARHSIGVAYSGGLDSSVLLHLAAGLASERGLTCRAFHIHHGLSANADQWLAHCQRQSQALGVHFHAARVEISGSDGASIEEAARVKRYQALGRLCREADCALLLTAHHQDDQAETVLMHLLRGSGVAGLAGMSEVNAAADLLGADLPVIARPLLEVSRAELEAYARQHGIAHVEDESNLDRRYLRNALRHAVMPVLASHFPGYAERLARSAQHAQSARLLLNETAATDLDHCRVKNALSVSRLTALSRPRIDNLLRHWLAVNGMRMPSTAWLDEMRDQILDAKADARLCVSHPQCDVRRYRDQVFITSKFQAPDPDDIDRLARRFAWAGEEHIAFPQYGGRLIFTPAEQGVGAAWLKEQALVLRYRRGGERVKPAWNRPTRSLKQHFQTLGVPAWERERLPIVGLAHEVLFAAGIGMDCRHFAAGDEPKIMLDWQFEPAFTS